MYERGSCDKIFVTASSFFYLSRRKALVAKRILKEIEASVI
ncbi:hypothetical protein RU95_GL001299 [Enterococcus avium]|nr:hypothetical protein RU95_GL001299 [Enterococcus avium]